MHKRIALVHAFSCESTWISVRLMTSVRAVKPMQSCVVLVVNLAQNGLQVHPLAQVRFLKKFSAAHLPEHLSSDLARALTSVRKNFRRHANSCSCVCSGDAIGMYIDMDEGKMWFYRNQQPWDELPGEMCFDAFCLQLRWSWSSSDMNRLLS